MAASVGNSGIANVTVAVSTGTLACTVATGNGIVVFCGNQHAAATITVTDNVGNTYTPATGNPFDETNDSYDLNAFWCPVSAGNITLITFTISGITSTMKGAYAEIIGAKPGSFIDTAATPATGYQGKAGSNATWRTNSLTPGVSGDLGIGFATTTFTTAITAGGAGWTVIQSDATTITGALASAPGLTLSATNPAFAGDTSHFGCSFVILIQSPAAVSQGTWVQNARNSLNTAYVNITPATGNALIINCNTSVGGGTPTVTLIEAYNATNGTGVLLTNTFVIPLATTQVVGGNWQTGAYILNIPAGVKSVLLHFNGGSPGVIIAQVVEVSGLTAFLTSARQYQAAPGTGANAITSTTSSVSSIPAYILGVTNNGGHTTTAAGTNFTLRGTVDANWFVEDRRETGATGSYAATATDATNGGTDAYTTCMMVFSDTVFVVQSVNTQSIVTNALTATINGVTAGNTLAAIASFWSQSSVSHNMIPPVTDTTFALSFQSLQTQNGTGTLPNNYGCGIWFLAGGIVVGGSHTVKLDFAPFGISLTQGSLTIVEISGVAAASPADPTQPAFVNGTTANTITVSSGQNLVAQPAIALAAVITGTSTGVANAAFSCAGFTDLTGSPDNNTTNGIGSEHVFKVYAVTGTTSAAFSWTDASTGRIQAVIGVLSSQSGIVTLPLLGMILM